MTLVEKNLSTFVLHRDFFIYSCEESLQINFEILWR